MTTINLASIPSSIGSLEELVAWAAYALRECAPTQAIAEAVNVTNFQVDLQESVTPDGKPILVCRFVFETLNLSAITGKRWNGIREIPRSAEIPSYYLSN